MRAWHRAATVATIDAAALLALWPDWHGVAGRLGDLHGWVATAGADGVVSELAGTALWCLAAWVAVGLAAIALADLPGRAGRAARGVAAAVMPRAALRLLAAMTGLGLAVIPATAGATPSPPPPPPPTTTSAPAWPTDGAAPPPPPPAPTTRPTTRPTAPRAPSTAVTVAPGDSLWLIAAKRLGDGAGDAAIASEWPRWYAANRDRIGADPSLIHPGQVLQAPAPQNRSTA